MLILGSYGFSSTQNRLKIGELIPNQTGKMLIIPLACMFGTETGEKEKNCAAMLNFKREQLIDSKAYIDINQGLDIRLMTEEKAEMISKLKVKAVHFAWDRYEDKDIILPKFKMFKGITKWGYRKLSVFVLVNFNTTFEQDLERIYTLRDMGYNPYVSNA